MTTILYKDGQFQTEDGICFEDQERINKAVCDHNFIGKTLSLCEGSTYSIREKVEMVELCNSRIGNPEATGCSACHGACEDVLKVARIIEEKEESEEHEVILNFFRKLADNQKPIPPEIAKAIKENLWTII
jgi:hypothetical protein